MKNLKLTTNKILSVFLALTIVLSLFSGIGFTAIADTTDNPYYDKVADISNLDGWKEFFGSEVTTTENAGGIWTDKSVFADSSAFENLKDAEGNDITPTVKDDSFLVALSAIASNKSIVGYSHIPTDTVLVLDVSGSMGPVPSGFGVNPSKYNDAVADLVLAANAAVHTLLNLNNNNRVGVVLYSDSDSVFLPVDRYTATNTVTYDGGTRNNPNDDITVGQYFVTNNNENRLTIADGVKNGRGNNVERTNRNVTGGTFIQGGLAEAANVFEERKNANDTVVAGDGFQGGTQRKPVIVLMSDGAPTYATTDYTNAENRNLGSGSSTNAAYAFLTQLTAAYVKQEITDYYGGSEALIYTLGLGVGNDATARSVLDPANSTTTVADYWEDFDEASNNSSVEISDGIRVTKNSAVTDIIYTDGYYSADTGSQLFGAFDNIVNQIIIQSLYRPTLVEGNNANMDGYIEFIDDIGEYMKVEQIEGVLIGDTLFTGKKLAENFQVGGGDLGSIDNPNALGDNLIWSVKERLGISDTATAQQLVTLAYEHGQLRYSGANNWSNYIGWYGGENGEFLGFWDESHTYSQIPTGAKFVNKSYGMLGEIKDGLNESDLMYVSIQVHTAIADKDTYGLTENDQILAGHAQLLFRIPASLVPVVTYEVELEGTGYDDARNITMQIKDAEPIRLLFEVGLRNDINPYNIERILGDSFRKDGKYYLYTNDWDIDVFNKSLSPDDDDYIAPTEAINTIAFFEPNLQNERYYYTEPTPVYYKDGDRYVKYSSNTVAPKDDTTGKEFYRKLNVFKLTGNGDEAILDGSTYEAISEKALEQAVKGETNGGWNIPKDIIHRTLDAIEIPKDDTTITNSLPYITFPSVQQIEGVHYYSDAILGNNGLLTITPATGISVTKTVDASLIGTTQAYEFTVNLDTADANTTYKLVTLNATGDYIEYPTINNFDASGNATISVYPGQTVFIVDIPEGNYTVRETAGENYEVLTSEGTSGTVAQYSIAAASFTNTRKQSGYLVIAKEVTHPFTAAPDSLYEKEFTFNISLSNGAETYPDNQIEYFYTSAQDDIKYADVTNNTAEVLLKADDSVVLKIREGWTAEVEETALPAGFTLASATDPTDKTVTATHNVVYGFVNNYRPAPANITIDINASKQLTGKPWTTDEFTFTVNRYNPSTARFDVIGEEKVEAPAQSDTVNFGDILAAAVNTQTFSSVGTYHFSISEVVPPNTKGITYDSASRDFNVIVTDKDTDGVLEISEITTASRTAVDGNTVTADKFINTYEADGIAEIILEINKTVDSTEEYSPEGFEFGLYDGDTLIGEAYKTDEDGIVQFILAFNADGVSYNTNKVINYVIKETKTALAGMTYADDIPVTITVKDNLDGTISATANVGTLNNGVYAIDVVNRYNPDDTVAQVAIEIGKTVKNTGTDKIGPEGFKFEIAEKIQTANAELVLDTVTTDENGKAEFAIEFTPEDIGTTVYTIKEVNEEKEYVTYSDKVYTFTVEVSLDENNKLVATVTSENAEVDGTLVTAEFENTYSHDLPEVKIDSKKTQAVNGADATDKATPVVPGDTVTYSITLTNNGEIESEAITVTDKIPEGLKFVDGSISGNGVLKDGVITWNIDSLDISESVTVSFKVTVPEVEENTVWKNIASVVYDKDHDDTPDEPDNSNEVQLIFELPEAPKTADITNLNLWLALLFVSGSSLALTVFYKKRKEEQND